MMEKSPKIVPEEIHLLKIDVNEKEMDIEAFKKAQSPKLNIAHKRMYNLKDERVKIELIFSFKNQKEEQLMLLQTDYHFQIENMRQFYELKEEQPVFFAPLLATVLGIAISTTRGILFEKLENQGIHNILIPILSPQKLLTESH
ncbi:MAG TPA: hypothetical protein VKY45_10830 [Marinilabiliaceae bacterium]|nr:hypothetical protein [Marinilabiliaceae bacterium]